MDVEAWKEKARKYRDQSLHVKTNDAYKALQHEIQYAETEVAQAEDRLLERMVAGEDFDRQIKAAEQAIAGVERMALASARKSKPNKPRCSRNSRPSRPSGSKRSRPFPRNSRRFTSAWPAGETTSAWRQSATKPARSAACASARTFFRNCAAKIATISFSVKRAREFFTTSSQNPLPHLADPPSPRMFAPMRFPPLALPVDVMFRPAR